MPFAVAAVRGFALSLDWFRSATVLGEPWQAVSQTAIRGGKVKH